MVKGREYFVNGDLRFPVDDQYCKQYDDGKFPGEYRTHFGPRFWSNTSTFASDNDGLRGAVRRLTCVRDPEIPGHHERLKQNQYDNVRLDRPGCVVWLTHFKGHLAETISNIRMDSEELRGVWTDNPHPKRQLRQATRRDAIAHGFQSGIRLTKIDYKVKSGEILPPTKYMRAVGDLTCPGSTVLGYYLDYVKSTFNKDFHYKGCVAKYIKPGRDSLKENFDSLINLKHNMYFGYFSDDSVCAIKCSDGTLWANCDISACDGSNYDPVFNLLKEAMSVDPRFENDVKACFDQLRAPCEIRSTQSMRKIGKERFKVLLKTAEQVLYSGSVLTTAVNNTAGTVIFLAIADNLTPNMTKAEATRIIEMSASSVGFKLKVEVCENIQDL